MRRRLPQVREYACREFLEGYDIIGLSNDRLPNLREITERLKPRTGWSTTAVSGFLPADAFFEMLEARMFPTTTWLRSRDSLAYIPEPDIFHDVFGHVPMHAHPVFADFLQHYGSVCAHISDAQALERLGRLFWYTVEFGLMRQENQDQSVRQRRDQFAWRMHQRDRGRLRSQGLSIWTKSWILP